MGAVGCRIAAFVALCLLSAGGARAQEAPPAGELRQAIPSREQITQPENPQPDQAARIDAGSALDRAPCALEGSDVSVTLTAVRFEDPSGGPIPEVLQTLLAPVAVPPVGPQPVSIVCQIRDRANAAMTEAGFIALTQIPAQQIESGVLRLQIVAARLSEIRIAGDLHGMESEIAARAQAMREQYPLNRQELEATLLNLNDVPGLSVELALSPARTAPGEVIGTLTVRAQRAQVLANVQNLGSQSLGPWIASLHGEVYGLTGLADRTAITVSNSLETRELSVVQGVHDFALTDHGLRALVRGSLAFSRPTIENLDLRSQSLIAAVQLQQSLIRSVGLRLDLAGGLELLQQRTRVFQGGSSSPFIRDKLRVAFARVDAQTRNYPIAGWEVRSDNYLEVRKGLSILGASQQGVPENDYSPSRFEGDPQALVVRGETVAEIRAPRLFALGLSGFGQWADHPLLNLEEWSLGNFTYGRGYDPGANGGDRVLALRVEPKITLPLALPVDVQLVGFHDWVWLDNLDPSSSETDRLLRSYGGGVRLQTGFAVLDAYYAHPRDLALTIDEAPPEDRFLFSLTTKLYPWGIR